MKPSERIAQLFDATKTVVTERITRTQTLEYGDIWQLCVEPLARYLDEQAELEQRRTHVRNALAMVSPLGDVTMVNTRLEAAGLAVRAAAGDGIGLLFQSIVDEAKREGLL